MDDFSSQVVYTNGKLFFEKRKWTIMPYVTIKMLAGRTEEQKRACVEKVTDAIVETTGASRDKVVVFLEDMKKSEYAVGGVLLSDEE